jgi:hypothetical protein
MSKKGKSSAKTAQGSSSEAIQELVERMIESGDLNEEGVVPENIKDLNAVEFVTAVAKYHMDALGSSKYNNRLEVNAWADASLANTLLELYEKAQPEVSGNIMKNAVEMLDISLDYSVMGSDAFQPKILPNGGVVIRNHHRVIGIDESPTLSIRMGVKDLRDELERALDGFDTSAKESLFNFSIVHRLPNGDVKITQSLPDELNPWGQTLILISGEFDLSKTLKLKNAGINEVFEASSTGMALLRTFEDRVLVYGMQRISDDYDTVVEEYVERPLSDLDEDVELKVRLDYQGLMRWVAERTEERIENSELKVPKGVMGYYANFSMCNPDNWNSYARRKGGQIAAFTPFFAEDADRPVHYYTDCDPYWDLSVAYDHKFAGAQLALETFSDLDDFRDRFAEVVTSQFFEPGEFPPHELRLIVDNPLWADPKKDLVKLDSKKAKEWLKEKADTIQAEIDSYMAETGGDDYEEAFNEIFRQGDLTIELAMIFKKKPDLVVLNRCMRQASEAVDGGGNLSVPHMGFCQGYDCGGYDTGNATVLLTEEEI